MFLFASTYSRADQLYTSRSAFNANSTGRTVVDFNGLATVGNGHDYPLLGLPLVLNGATFTSPGLAAVVDGQNVFTPTTTYTGDGFLIVDYGSPDTINVTFPGSTAVGLDVGGLFGDPASITVTLSDGTVDTLSSLSGDYATGGTLGFLGFTSSTPITSLSIVYAANGGGNSFGAIDNFTYGTMSVPSVPEPSSLLLLGTGLGGAAGAFRQRILRR